MLRGDTAAYQRFIDGALFSFFRHNLCLIKVIVGLWSKIIWTCACARTHAHICVYTCTYMYMYVYVYMHVYVNTSTDRNSARLIDSRRSVVAASNSNSSDRNCHCTPLAQTQLIRGETMSRNVKLVTVRETRALTGYDCQRRADKYCNAVTKPGGTLGSSWPNIDRAPWYRMMKQWFSSLVRVNKIRNTHDDGNIKIWRFFRNKLCYPRVEKENKMSLTCQASLFRILPY